MYLDHHQKRTFEPPEPTLSMANYLILMVVCNRSPEPFDRIGMCPFDPDVSGASMIVPCSGRCSPLAEMGTRYFKSTDGTSTRYRNSVLFKRKIC